ncbi:hypothetical protein JBL43_16630 [Aureibaculum sp. A20]|uniref:Lipoprotein n=1 Tax=Aureibaculum flavum TaxID=2795986 RepID=A0ABS0WV92_9FLAO|nr:hypothetical protein [Aureibaculum flavum]MBJ2175882.1 hypothetical protein [Aureibaculum flavum]
MGLISCSTHNQEKKIIDMESLNEPVVVTNSIKVKPNYRKIVLSENSLDTFSIPFPEKNMLDSLRSYYEPYLVEYNVGQQDGPDYRYIDISREDKNPIAYLNFESDNELRLNEIRIINSTALDQYEVHVEDPLTKVITSRGTGEIVFDPYHFHIYYYYKNSNISYELEGELHTPAVKNVEDIVLTYDDINSHTVQSIIWRNKK